MEKRANVKCYLCGKRISKGFLVYTISGKRAIPVEVCESCYLGRTERCEVCGFEFVDDVLEEVSSVVMCDICNGG